MRTIILLIISNSFMTYAWYGHLKQTETALWKVILLSWGIAFFEYCFMVPANRLGYQEGFSGFQLKTIQEVITLSIFAIFAVFILKEPLRWNYLISFLFLVGAVYFMFKK
ncbi:DMT family protein [Chitinophaga sp. sic0106]|uniref:DMT family protein n=1 Tax=Chitinophaga sp. sic0106 TaxID=2854785 RepID=UPI001C43CB3D|nr:DMT family protein [Chitinophaga sp. sic0106]MBV7529946.1 DMT family protein [Chitinophaga sp. sic0106]